MYFQPQVNSLLMPMIGYGFRSTKHLGSQFPDGPSLEKMGLPWQMSYFLIDFGSLKLVSTTC